MKSRYDLMEDSNIKAEDGTFYPDVMTFKIKKFRYTETPNEFITNEINIRRKDLLVFNFYNETDFDDIVLFLNRVADFHELEIEDILYIPTKDNMDKFYLRYRE